MTKSEKKAEKRRSEPRTLLDHYTSVEFSISKQDPIFQFRVRDTSPSGMGILVNEGSMALKYLKVGQVLNMKYNPVDPYGSPEKMETEIRHITLLDTGRYRGHYLVGLSIKNGSEMTRRKLKGSLKAQQNSWSVHPTKKK